MKCAEFTLICGPNRTERYAKKADLKQMDEFLRKIFPNHTNKLPGNLVSVWIPRTNFKTGKSFQQFEPSGGVAPGSWFCYRMVCDRVQETLYCVDVGDRDATATRQTFCRENGTWRAFVFT